MRTLRDWNGIPGRICAACFSEQQKTEILIEGCTWFESLAIHSIREALKGTDVDPSSDDVVLVMSTTKGEIDELSPSADKDGAFLDPGAAAAKIAAAFNMTTKPVVVCNACISGVAAQILADRLIASGRCTTAIVCGADTLSRFSVAGFTSFKSLSPTICRPFDIERLGLNLGEAAATVILRGGSDEGGSLWKLAAGHLDNDAFHVSAPAPDGDGVLRAIEKTVGTSGRPGLATVSAHGTATMFNDQMESRAIEASGLSDIPVSAYKAYFGHTLGACGILESIITMCSIDDGVILPVAGFEEIGVSGKINISDKTRSTDKKEFLKIISGFGGCNGAILYSKTAQEPVRTNAQTSHTLAGSVRITPDSASIDGDVLQTCAKGQPLLTELFKKYVPDSPKFYKMDAFSRLAFVAVGLLLKNRPVVGAPETTSILLFNRTSSIVADRQHLGTFPSAEEFYPSPSVFLYTLPNVVLGEIAIKYGIKGETTFVILPDKDENQIEMIKDAVLSNSSPESLIYGWADCCDESVFEAELKLIVNKH